MRHRFILCDVFTDLRFAGNPLAVLPDAAGLDSARMQQIAREFNFSETTFVLPPEAGGTRRVRIFTPAREVPFAGHPNIGTAAMLAQDGAFGSIPLALQVVFEEAAGSVPIRIEPAASGSFRCELQAPEPLRLGPAVDAALVAAALGVPAGHLLPSIQEASVGLPFLLVGVRERAILQALAPRLDGFADLREQGINPDLHVYALDASADPAAGARGDGGFDLYTRGFFPLDGIVEDPATGSANCALAGLLAARHPLATGRLHWRIAQGIEMGRPSVLEAVVEKRAGQVAAVHIGGRSVRVAEGWIETG